MSGIADFDGNYQQDEVRVFVCLAEPSPPVSIKGFFVVTPKVNPYLYP